MTTLNKEFQQKLILTAEELNDVVSKINEIVTLLSSLPEGTSGITDAQIKAKIDEAIEDANSLIDAAILNLQDQITELKNIQEGSTEVVTAEEWAQYRKKTSDLETDVAAIKLSYEGIDLVALKQTVDDINEWAGSISVDPGKIEILAALLDENNELIIKPAAIIAAIKDEDGKLTSEIAISANQVILDGDVTLTRGLTTINADIANLKTAKANVDDLTALNTTITGKLDAAVADITELKSKKANADDLYALEATVNNLNVPDVATIKKAVIDDIEAGNVTITGDLQYGRIIGNIYPVSGEGDNDHIIIPDGTSVASVAYPTSNEVGVELLEFPQNPANGQVLYILNLGHVLKVQANTPMYVWKQTTSNDGATVQYSYTTVNANTQISPSEYGWREGLYVQQFIYDGSKWIQLTAVPEGSTVYTRS